MPAVRLTCVRVWASRRLLWLVPPRCAGCLVACECCSCAPYQVGCCVSLRAWRRKRFAVEPYRFPSFRGRALTALWWLESGLAPLSGRLERPTAGGVALVNPGHALDARARAAGPLCDFPVLCFEHDACGRVAVEAAQDRARHLPVRANRSVLVDNVEKDELGPSCRFLTTHIAPWF